MRLFRAWFCWYRRLNCPLTVLTLNRPLSNRKLLTGVRLGVPLVIIVVVKLKRRALKWPMVTLCNIARVFGVISAEIMNRRLLCKMCTIDTLTLYGAADVPGQLKSR